MSYAAERLPERSAFRRRSERRAQLAERCAGARRRARWLGLLMIAGDIERARFRSSFEHPEPLVPGNITRYQVPLHTRAHAFLKGHRIKVQVQSSWFPLYDRNPQRFVPSIFAAEESDFIAATQRIYRSGAAPSAIVLPLLAR